jgi:hypothetical protein
MEPLYTGKQNGKDDFDPADPAHWRLVCRPCKDIAGCGA